MCLGCLKAVCLYLFEGQMLTQDLFANGRPPHTFWAHPLGVTVFGSFCMTDALESNFYAVRLSKTCFPQVASKRNQGFGHAIPIGPFCKCCHHVLLCPLAETPFMHRLQGP
eukprot:6465613-Amphidinium_carterae.1